MAGREALVDDVEEGAGDVGLHLLGEGWVEPSYPSLATSPRWCSRLLGGRVVGELVRVAGLLQSLLVQWGGSVEDGLTGGEPGEPVVDPPGNGADDAGGVVAVPVDVFYNMFCNKS